MSAIPVGYEALQGMRRKSISLLCLFLASAMAMGIFVYIDSYSIHEWDDRVGNVGPVAMTVGGESVQRYVDEITNLPEVTHAASMEYVHTTVANVGGADNDYYYGSYARVGIVSEEYSEIFPDRFQFVEGHIPENTSSIAISPILAESMDIWIGDTLNYTIEETISPYGEIEGVYRLLTICGIFTDSISSQYGYGYGYWGETTALVVPELVDGYDLYLETEISLDVDRTQLTPFNPQQSLSYLLNIEESIREMDPLYNPPEYYSYNIWVNDFLARAVSDYINWQTMTRFTQIIRSAASILLVVLVVFLSIRFNMNDRRYENSMLMSRGAARSDIERRILKEIAFLTIIGTLVGLGVGVLLSRIGLASTGFFKFDVSLFFTEPFLISVESIIFAVVIGVLLPLFTWIGYNGIYSTKRKVDESTGKLEKVARILAIIRWDVILFVLSALMLIGLSSLGRALQYAPLLAMLAGIMPLVLLVSLGSLTIKGLRRGANILSRGMNRIVGILPSSIGVRRLGKGASSGGITVLILVLAISISWTYSVIDSSMPLTKQNHGRFAFGGDVAFHLGSYPTPAWTNFTANVTAHASTAAATTINKIKVILSSEYYDRAYIVGMNPLEFQYVGYDQWGVQLNSSDLSPLMETLAATPSGAIITSDIAAKYDLSTGDSIRAFSYYDSSEFFVFTIVGIADALSNSMLLDTGSNPDYGFYFYDTSVGTNTFWVNNEYLGSLVSLANDTENILCVRTKKGVNGTAFVQDILSQGGDTVFPEQNGWAAVTYEVESFTSSTAYRIDRAVDTLLSIATSAVIFAGFIIYAFEGVTARKREIALIRSMGGSRRLVLKAQLAEISMLILASILLLVVFGPLYIINTLIGIRTSVYTFPVSVYPVFPMLTMLTVLLFFVGTAILFALVVSILSTRINLSEALNASWAESGPYGGDV